MDYNKLKQHYNLIEEDSTDEFIENILIDCLSPLVKESLIDSDNIELINFFKLILQNYKNYNFKKYKLIYLIEFIDKFINDDLLKPNPIIRMTLCPRRKLSTEEAIEKNRKYGREYYHNNKEKYNKPKKSITILSEEKKEILKQKKREYYLKKKMKIKNPE